MKNIEKLTNEIRSKLSYLMELKEGCVIKDKLNSFTYKVIENNYCPQLYSFEYSSFKTLEFEDLKNFEIIGSEPQLNDVLRWLDLIRIKPKFPIADIEKEMDLEIIRSLYGRLCFDWDLTKPYLKDQSQELIDNLTNLI